MAFIKSLRVLPLVTAMVGMAGCGGNAGPTAVDVVRSRATLEEAMALLDARQAWQEHPPLNLPRHPAERFLRGWVIVLDPGHGGDAHIEGYKRGPTGAREAEMNWRVAVLLKRLLEDAGAHVTLTRDGDEEVSLVDRAAVANNIARPDGGTGADLFLSLHHDATSANPTRNHTVVWYHGEVDWSEPSLDVARYLAHHIARALRTNVGVTSPLNSDQLMYQGGFGVLRNLQVPGVLIEASFYSNPDEEQRLQDARYNLREAYAIYEALCEYAYGGRPTQTTPVAAVSEDGTITLTSTLDDGLPKNWWGSHRNRIITSTIAARLNNQPLPVRFDPASRTLTITGLTRTQLERSPVIISIHHANLFKHHNWPQRYRLTRTAEGQVTVEPVGPIRAKRVPD